MLGISYGELFLLIGATAALVGPKDLPRIARTAGRLAGRSIGYVQLARGQFESVMQQSQARQVHKELQDTMAQLEAIRHEIRSISIINPGPMTRMMDTLPHPTPDANVGDTVSEKHEEEQRPTYAVTKEYNLRTSNSTDLHSRATSYARLAESTAASASDSQKESAFNVNKLGDEADFPSIIPISAESAGLLPSHKENANGSDIVLEAIIEAEVAHNAKDFFSQPQNQLPSE